MIIRKLEKSDMEQLACLYEQFWGEKSDISKMICQFDIIERENNHILLVAEKDGLIIGSVMGIVCKLYGDCSPFLIIENMIIDRHSRKIGIGSILLSELESIAKNLHCSQMILVTEEDRYDARNFYEKYGFQKNNKGYKKKI